MKARWTMIVLAAALGLAACETDEFGTTGSGLPTDVSQDSLLIEGPGLEFLAVEVVTPDTLQSFDQRSRLFLGNRDRDGFRATPVLRFDFDEENLRNALLEALLEQTANDDVVGIAASEAFADTVTFTPALFDSVELQMEVISRDLAREQDEADPGRKKFPRAVQLYEASRTVVASDAASNAVSDLVGGELSTGLVDATLSPPMRIRLPIDRVIAWIDAQAHDGIVVFDRGPGNVEYAFPNESNTIAFTSQSGSGAPEILFRVADAALPDLGFNDVAFAAPITLDFTVIEQDPPGADEALVGSHRVRRTWMQLDVGPDVLPRNATINQAVMTWYPRNDLTLGTVESGADSSAITVLCYEATRAEATREDPRSTNNSAGLVALDFVGQSGFSPALGDTLRIDITRFVQRAVNSIVDPTEVGLLVFLNAELTDLDQGAFFGPSVADTSLAPRVRITFTPPADSWR